MSNNITKKTLARSLQHLMVDRDFDKISVKDICLESDINRKTFYYHFFDKYALLDWAFYTDCVMPADRLGEPNFFDTIRILVYKLDEQKDFYRKAFCIHAKNSYVDPTINSFQLFFIKQIKHLLKKNVMASLGSYEKKEYYLYFDFYLDTMSSALTNNIQQWLLEHPELNVEEYLSLLKEMVHQNQVEFHKHKF